MLSIPLIVSAFGHQEGGLGTWWSSRVRRPDFTVNGRAGYVGWCGTGTGAWLSWTACWWGVDGSAPPDRPRSCVVGRGGRGGSNCIFWRGPWAGSPWGRVSCQGSVMLYRANLCFDAETFHVRPICAHTPGTETTRLMSLAPRLPPCPAPFMLYATALLGLPRLRPRALRASDWAAGLAPPFGSPPPVGEAQRAVNAVAPAPAGMRSGLRAATSAAAHWGQLPKATKDVTHGSGGGGHSARPRTPTTPPPSRVG